MFSLLSSPSCRQTIPMSSSSSLYCSISPSSHLPLYSIAFFPLISHLPNYPFHLALLRSHQAAMLAWKTRSGECFHSHPVCYGLRNAGAIWPTSQTSGLRACYICQYLSPHTGDNCAECAKQLERCKEAGKIPPAPELAPQEELGHGTMPDRPQTNSKTRCCIIC